MISSSCIIGGGFILRSEVRTFFGLLTNRGVNFWRRRRGQGAQFRESLLLAALELPDFFGDLILGVADLVFDGIFLLFRELPGAVILIIRGSVI